ncbi:DUF1758 domain-containing protein [Trichonephila clavipes]|nr:DUF1758 domain-containing protein [Trichonephila clavipes]
MQGGICFLGQRYAHANNPYLSCHNPCEPPNYIVSLDVNNLYGFCVSEYLPKGDFRWLLPEEIANFNVMIISRSSSTGYLLEVDLMYDESDPGTKFKLPNIELPTFDGNPRDWLNFWTQFEKIHDDVNIDDRDKFQYLIQSTAPRSSPREIVESFPATAANYKKAIEYLKERYGNTSVLIQVYIRDLLQLVMAKNKSDLSSLYDKLQTLIRALDSLGLTKEKFADILFPLVESVDIVKL